jgi:hypothetical protein
MEHKSLREYFNDLPPLKFKSSHKLEAWQQLGVAFLLRSREKFKFALVGDEMGVGKVIPPLSQRSLIDNPNTRVHVQYQSTPSKQPEHFD